VTDFDLHAMWVQPALDGYCAAAVEVGWRMRDRGIAGEAIAVTGIPIMPAFARPPARAQCAAELGIDPDHPTALLMSGGAGIGALDRMAEALLAGDPRLQVLALAGRNHDLHRRLEELAARARGRLRAIPFTDQVERVMACADLAVSKPGGLTTAECMAMGLPMVVVSPLPGQEERNADYLLEQGIGVRAYDLTGMVERVRMLLDDRSRLARMRAQALRLARPQAAGAVLETALARISARLPRAS
jgi:processive 1,2-diacylglycerol beta-glucosyltransferase